MALRYLIFERVAHFLGRNPVPPVQNQQLLEAYKTTILLSRVHDGVITVWWTCAVRTN